MNVLPPFRLRAMRAAWPATLLVLMLQRTPLLRVLASSEFALGVRTGQMLRALLPAAAAVGAVNTLTGATRFATNPTSPAHGSVGQSFNLLFAVTGAQTPAGSYGIDGPLPVGLSVPGATGSAGALTLNDSAGAITGIPTQSGSFNVTISAFQFSDRGGDSIPPLNVTIVIAAVDTAPSFTQQPQSTTVNFGESASFTVAVSGTPTPTLQWRKGGVAVSGQTGTTLTISNAQLADAGSYDCVATNSVNSVPSNAVTLTVNPPPAPTITSKPTDLTARLGSLAFFAVQASGAGNTFQWRKNSADIPGATASSFLLVNVVASDAGAYSVRITNAGGSVTSDDAMLAVQATGTARLSNLSTRAQVGTDGNILIPGFVIDRGASKNLLIRAVGPKLAAFGVADVLADPTMTLFDKDKVQVQANDDWQLAPGQVAMESARAAVLAFELAPSVKDASLLLNLAAGSYTVQTSGVGATTGVALVELYDVDPLSSPARLVNISARAQVGTGANVLIPGFVIEGDVAQTLLIRAIGPRLADFGVSGVLADPVMTIFRGGTPIVSNDNWEQYPDQNPLAAATAATFAFSLNPGGADAAMLVVLAPGAYTVQVSGKNDTTGVALVELYLVGP